MQDSSVSVRKVVFFHIPKTGGMTFAGVLERLYPNSFGVCSDPSIQAVELALQKFDCFEFHTQPYKGGLPYMHQEIAAKDRWDLLIGKDIFTMLRDPVAQSISLYFQLVDARALLEPIFYKRYRIPFPESLEEFIEMPWHFNSQVRFLIGDYLKTPMELVPEDLSQVKDWMQKLGVHVGLTERYADSLHVLEKVTGREIGENIERRQENRNRISASEIPEELKRKIRRQSEMDLELYEFGREQFEKDYRTFGAGREYSYTSGKFVGPTVSDDENATHENDEDGKAAARKLIHSRRKRKRVKLAVLAIQSIVGVKRLLRKKRPESFVRSLPK